jgi:hypothetical protein
LAGSDILRTSVSQRYVHGRSVVRLTESPGGQARPAFEGAVKVAGLDITQRISPNQLNDGHDSKN